MNNILFPTHCIHMIDFKKKIMAKNIWDTNWKQNTKFDIHPILIKIIKKYVKGKKILEVGYGTGGDLITLSRMGYNCYGIDTSRVAYNRLKEIKKLQIFLQDGRCTKFMDEDFDLVFHQGLMEHFKNPNSLISENRRILKKSGILIIDVPHKWNLFTLYKSVLMILHKWYGGWETSYSANSLTKLIVRNGFKVLDIQYRGIFPHQLAKLIYPKKISNVKIKRIFDLVPFRHLHQIVHFMYTRFRIVNVIISYNIIVIAQKNENWI